MKLLVLLEKRWKATRSTRATAWVRRSPKPSQGNGGLTPTPLNLPGNGPGKGNNGRQVGAMIGKHKMHTPGMPGSGLLARNNLATIKSPQGRIPWLSFSDQGHRHVQVIVPYPRGVPFKSSSRKRSRSRSRTSRERRRTSNAGCLGWPSAPSAWSCSLLASAVSSSCRPCARSIASWPATRIRRRKPQYRQQGL